MLSQAQFIRNYNDANKLPFNDELFERNEDEIVREVMKIILSAQRENEIFSLLVDSFTVVEDYDKINEILANWKNVTQKRKKKKEPNEYEFVNLKDTDAKLLIVNYFIKVKDEMRMLDVYILIPKIVNKYYFRIGGNMWLAMLQIVDGSTYNNSLTSNPKKQSISFKTTMPARMFKNSIIFKDVVGEQFECNYYTSNIFKKTLPFFKYILAKYGLLGTQVFTQIDCIYFSEQQMLDNQTYCVKIKEGIYINVPKYIFDNNQVVQSLYYTMYDCVNRAKKPTLAHIMTNEFWLEALGEEFKTPTAKKGLELLTSLEGIYDISTKEILKLKEESKRDIYSILLWIAREFQRLRQKDNLDVTLKRIRYGEYIASIYGMKLVKGIKRITDSKNKITIDKICQSIRTKPTALLDSICKCNLVNYRNLVNDLDSLLAVKYSYKGISGIGDDSSQSIPTIYRYVHPSHMGILDIDSSPKSDPGISGVLCPMVKLYDSYFSDYDEPDFWEEEFRQTMTEYRSMVNKKELLHYKRRVGMKYDPEELNVIESNIQAAQNIISPVLYQHNDKRVEVYQPIIDLGAKVYFE